MVRLVDAPRWGFACPVRGAAFRICRETGADRKDSEGAPGRPRLAVAGLAEREVDCDVKTREPLLTMPEFAHTPALIAAVAQG